MGNIGIIARRLSDGHVQYGWGGFGAKCRLLLTEYAAPDMVEYLFGLGQLKRLWEPYSETIPGRVFKTTCIGKPHEVGATERDIFRKIPFADYGCFFDTDQQWYYIIAGPLRIKLPLTLVAHHLDEHEDESKFVDEVVTAVGKHLLGKRYQEDQVYRAYLDDQNITSETVQELFSKFSKKTGWQAMNDIWLYHQTILQYFDDWVLIRSDGDDQEIGEIVLRKAETPRVETICW